MNNLEYYRKFEKLLLAIREKTNGEESAFEDAVLDEMDLLWYKLTDEELASLQQEGSKCWPTLLASVE